MEIKSEDDFKEMITQSDKPVLVDFWAPWCGPCQMVSPIVEVLSKEYSGKVHVCKVNIDELPSIAQQYQVMGIPTIALFKDGKVFDRIVGAAPKDAIEAPLKQLLGE